MIKTHFNFLHLQVGIENVGHGWIRTTGPALTKEEERMKVRKRKQQSEC